MLSKTKKRLLMQLKPPKTAAGVGHNPFVSPVSLQMLPSNQRWEGKLTPPALTPQSSFAPLQTAFVAANNQPPAPPRHVPR